MIINGPEKDVVTNKNNINEMKMKVDEKAFNILIDKLYTHKPQAIIREICANAIDAHIAAGKYDVPFEITIPTYSNNKLIIRDFGNGLSKQETEDLLGTIFGSKSSESNDLIGGFGLGSKSPFSMVDSYYIHSYNNGEEHKFLFVREKGAIPKFIHVYSKPSDELADIKFVITMDDLENNYVDWQSIVEDTLIFAKVPFVITNSDYKIPQKHNIHDLFYIVENTNKTNITNNDYMAVMGGVIYPINMSEFDNNIKNRVSELRRGLDIRKSSNTKIAIEFDIGELDVTPSREQIELTSKTLKAIDNKINEISKNKHKLLKHIIKHYRFNIFKMSFDDIVKSDILVKYSSFTYRKRLFNNKDILKYPGLKDLLPENQINIKNSIDFFKISYYSKGPIRSYQSVPILNSQKIIINDTHRTIGSINETFGNKRDIYVVNSDDKKSVLFYMIRYLDWLHGKENYDLILISDFKIEKKKTKSVNSSNGIYSQYFYKSYLKYSDIKKGKIAYLPYGFARNSDNELVLNHFRTSEKYDEYTRVILTKEVVKSVQENNPGAINVSLIDEQEIINDFIDSVTDNVSKICYAEYSSLKDIIRKRIYNNSDKYSETLKKSLLKKKMNNLKVVDGKVKITELTDYFLIGKSSLPYLKDIEIDVDILSKNIQNTIEELSTYQVLEELLCNTNHKFY